MASATPVQVRVTAREGSALYHLQLGFNALVAWSVTHVHNGAFGNPSTPRLSVGTKLIAMADGKMPDGSTPLWPAADVVNATVRRARPESFEHDFLMMWQEVLVPADLHAHTGGAGTGPTGATPERRVVNLEGRSEDNVVISVNVVDIRQSSMPGSDESELRRQWNNWMTWFFTHSHSGLGVAPAPQPTAVSKIADMAGRDPLGVVVTA